MCGRGRLSGRARSAAWVGVRRRRRAHLELRRINVLIVGAARSARPRPRRVPALVPSEEIHGGVWAIEEPGRSGGARSESRGGRSEPWQRFLGRCPSPSKTGAGHARTVPVELGAHLGNEIEKALAFFAWMSSQGLDAATVIAAAVAPARGRRGELRRAAATLSSSRGTSIVS